MPRTDENQAGRLWWARDNEKREWRRHVDLDEKWFYVWSKRVKLKLPPGVARLKSKQKSKRFICKVMMVTAIARSEPAHGFDGKVGIWRCCKRRPALRGDKRIGLKKGTMLTEDVNMDGKMSEQMLRDKAIAAIRDKMA